MPILNYTTSISAEKTVMEIQAVLAKAGAKAIMMEYDDHQNIISLSFQIEVRGHRMSFVLPANAGGIYSVLCKDPKVPKAKKTTDQATKVGWRIVKGWVEAQIAMIESEQADLVQVFLPYAQDASGQTVYQSLKDKQFRGVLGYDHSKG